MTHEPSKILQNMGNLAKKVLEAYKSIVDDDEVVRTLKTVSLDDIKAHPSNDVETAIKERIESPFAELIYEHGKGQLKYSAGWRIADIEEKIGVLCSTFLGRMDTSTGDERKTLADHLYKSWKSYHTTGDIPGAPRLKKKLKSIRHDDELLVNAMALYALESTEGYHDKAVELKPLLGQYPREQYEKVKAAKNSFQPTIDRAMEKSSYFLGAGLSAEDGNWILYVGIQGSDTKPDEISPDDLKLIKDILGTEHEGYKIHLHNVGTIYAL